MQHAVLLSSVYVFVSVQVDGKMTLGKGGFA